MTLPFEYINELRSAELRSVVPLLRPGIRVLELGAGSGRQALELDRLGFDVSAIDLPTSNYAANRVFPVIDYDGTTIPFPDRSFDAVFSSNVLEHVKDLPRMHDELRRVLARNGECFHILPTSSWRFWSSLAALPAAARAGVREGPGVGLRKAARAVLQKPHGERGNVLTELWYFRPEWWRRNFRDNGFEIVRDAPVGLFYTGEVLRGLTLSMAYRRRLAGFLGSSTWLFQLRRAETAA